MIRKIDDLGRIVLPKEMRKQLFISSGDKLIVSLIDNGIQLKKFNDISNMQQHFEDLDITIINAAEEIGLERVNEIRARIKEIKRLLRPTKPLNN